MINLKPFRASNTRLLIEEEANRINNVIDCDVIEEAKGQVIAPEATKKEITDAIEYLIVAVAFRGGNTKLLKQYQADYLACI